MLNKLVATFPIASYKEMQIQEKEFFHNGREESFE